MPESDRNNLHVRLLVPGLLGPMPGMQAPDYPWPKCPVLERMLGRAIPHPGPRTRLELLPEHFLNAERPVGAARLSWLGEFGQLAPGPLLRADAVHLRADRDQLLLYGPETLQLSREEAESLAAAFNAHFQSEKLRLQLEPQGRGYLHLAQEPIIETRPIEEAVGQPVTDFVLGGEEAKAWKRRLTEIQMLFANHHVNLRRQVEGRPVVNGLWCWGEGEPAVPRRDLHRPTTLHVSDPVFRGLAYHCSLGCAPPAGLEDGFRLPESGGEHWYFLEDIKPLAAYGELEAWQEALLALDRNWLQPAFEALRTGRMRLLDLVPMNGRIYRLRRRHAWIPWRKEHPARHVRHD